MSVFTATDSGNITAVRTRASEATPAVPPIRPRTVSLEELRKAWAALEAGQFRPRDPYPTHETSTTEPVTVKATTARTAPAFRPPVSGPAAWARAEGEQVLPVLGCGGSSGASTLAVALATVALTTRRAAGGETIDSVVNWGSLGWEAARVIDCGSLTASGLAAASTSELGGHPSGWRRGTRGHVLLERADAHVTGPDTVPAPCAWSVPGGSRRLTVLDLGWDLERILGGPSWIRTHVFAAQTLVLTTTATVPGLRRLEVYLDLLATTTASSHGPAESHDCPGSESRVVAVVQGPSRRRWPRPVAHSLGTRTRALDSEGRLAVAPRDRRLTVTGLDPAPLPASLLRAATRLLDQIATDALGATP